MLIDTNDDFNARYYRRVFNIENWLRKIVYAAGVLVFGEHLKSSIDSEVRKRYESRRNDYRHYAHLTDETLYAHPIWLASLDDLRIIMSHEKIMHHLKSWTRIGTRSFEAKYSELECLRNIVAHNHYLLRSADGEYESICRYFESIIKDFKQSFDVFLQTAAYKPMSLASERKSRRLRGTRIVKGNEEEYLPYVVGTRLDKDSRVQVTAHATKDNYIIWVSAKHGYEIDLKLVFEQIDQADMYQYLLGVWHRCAVRVKGPSCQVPADEDGDETYTHHDLVVLKQSQIGWVVSKRINDSKSDQDRISKIISDPSYIHGPADINQPDIDYEHPIMWKDVDYSYPDIRLDITDGGG